MRKDLKSMSLVMGGPAPFINSDGTTLDFYKVYDKDEEDGNRPLFAFSVEHGEDTLARFIFRSIKSGQAVLRAHNITNEKITKTFGPHVAADEAFKVK